MTVLNEQQIERYRRDGYLIFETGIPTTMLDGAVADIAEYWEQKKLRSSSHIDDGRLQDGWLVSENIKNIATFPSVLSALQVLYDRKPLPFQTLNFPRGTEQKVHADNVHFNSEPFGFMCGVWIALEDIGPDQGPLVYYPGSHKLPEMNFEEFGLEADYANYPQYEARIENLIIERRFTPEYGIVKKGSAIVWAANLLHGGSPQRDKSLSRHSQVTHYFFEDGKYWRPGYSRKARHYFDPMWIPCAENRVPARGLRRIKHALQTGVTKYRLLKK
ncbi:MAG TPA: phytanoyl-CoA dioxygenase family protein [Paucimonas sp.]|nr:phytanoyl-CoA dioxygenase family protein [Paucimonas sp.]